MREGRANGGADGEGGGEGGDSAAMGELRRRRQPSSSASAASSSSGRREEAEAEEERGGGKNKKQGKRKNQRREAVAKAIRDRLHAAVAPSCWGNVSVVQGIGGSRIRRSQREGAVDDDGGGSESGPGTTARAPPAAAWCCVCPDVDCALEANPSANGKEDAGLRSLLERNDFYSDDCNLHAAASPNPGDHPD